MNDDITSNLSAEEAERIHALLLEDAEDQAKLNPPVDFLKDKYGGSTVDESNNSRPSSAMKVDVNLSSSGSARQVPPSPRSIRFQEEVVISPVPLRASSLLKSDGVVDAKNDDGGGGGSSGGTDLYSQVRSRMKRSMSMLSNTELAKKSAKAWQAKAKSRRGSKTPRNNRKRQSVADTKQRISEVRQKSRTQDFSRSVSESSMQQSPQSSFKELFQAFKESKNAPPPSGKHEETFAPQFSESRESDDIVVKTRTSTSNDGGGSEKLMKRVNELETRVKVTSEKLDSERQRRRGVEKERLMLKSDLNEARRQLNRVKDISTKLELDLKQAQSQLDEKSHELQIAKNLSENDPQNRRLHFEVKQRDMVIGELCTRINVLEAERQKAIGENRELVAKQSDSQSTTSSLERRLALLEKAVQLSRRPATRGCCSGRSSESSPSDNETEKSDTDQPLLSTNGDEEEPDVPEEVPIKKSTSWFWCGSR